MSIFDLHSQVLADYRDFVRSFLLIADERAREFVNRALDEEARLWPDFLVQISPSYAAGATVDELAQQGEIARETAQVFRAPDGKPFHLYRREDEGPSARRSGEGVLSLPAERGLARGSGGFR